MSTSTLVSVIVAAHNEERYLGRCLRSLLAQRFERSRYDVIVIDDASTDRTSAVLATFGDSITVLRNETNLGLPASLNRAITSTHSKFIVRVDADDYVNSAFLDVMYMFLADNPQFDAAACDYLLVDDREEVISRRDAVKEPIACGIMFELPILIYFLTKIGLVTPEFLKKYRKIALVLVLVLSAVITPPDIASQVIVAIPVMILYQVSISISKFVTRKERKNAT